MARKSNTTWFLFGLLTLLVVSPGSARADEVNLATISFDILIPPPPSPGTNGFDIFNFTDGSNLLPDFPVGDGLSFLASSLILTGTQPNPSNPSLNIPLSETVSLGDIAAGALVDPSTGFTPLGLQFPDTFSFTQAEFKATLSDTLFHLADGGVLANGNPYPSGSVFTADSPSVDVFITPSSGTNLTAGIDQAVISVSGAVSAAVIPEPASGSLLLLLLPWVGAWSYRRRKARTTDPVA